MAHPHLEQAVPLGIGAVLDAFEQIGMATRAHLGIAELAHSAKLYLAAELRGHGLHPVADPEHGYTDLEHRTRCMRRAAFVGGRVTARENHAARSKAADEFITDVPWMDLAVDMRFANSTRDELRVLRSKVED